MLIICSNNRALCWASCALGRAGICVTPATLRLLLAGGEQQRDVPWPGWNIIVPLTHSCPQEWRGMFLTKKSPQFEGGMKLFCSGSHEGHSTFACGCKHTFSVRKSRGSWNSCSLLEECQCQPVDVFHGQSIVVLSHVNSASGGSFLSAAGALLTLVSLSGLCWSRWPPRWQRRAGRWP